MRTDRRGANAAELHLVKRTRVILGPGTLIEVIRPEQIRLIEGEMEITVPAKAQLEMVGPDRTAGRRQGHKAAIRIGKEKLVGLDKEPAWLLGFKGTTTDNMIGSLVALVDGRNVPLCGRLSQGHGRYPRSDRPHRDRGIVCQPHRQLLEGVFHFPLPADASISGFGMWIGDQLVEADVVEKQRAREIYETILREKRDPGLLEWSGGNIFKARVWPIQPQSESASRSSTPRCCRLRATAIGIITALVSDLLEQHPLRE